jgi:hypothetical protein
MERSKTPSQHSVQANEKSASKSNLGTEELQKILREKDFLIKKFEEEHIFDEHHKYRKTVKVKNYVDNSRYEG